MFADLTPQPPDKIIELMGLYKADPREDKIDLGVGVYKDSNGETPVMRAVKAAEARLLESQRSKSYVGLRGDLGFVAAMRALVLGAIPEDRVAGSQMPGGTGAVRQLFELVRLANPGATIWISDPSWPNHVAIARAMGMPFKLYRYFDEATRAVDQGAMMDDLAGMAAGDVLLLHGCCHNPTGANLRPTDWAALTELCVAKGVTPMVDIAYQGFGDGLEADVAPLRAMAAAVPELMVAASCSKNFGLYRDRVGCALVVTDRRPVVEGALASVNRLNWSFPPDHGAKAVEIILTDAALRADWAAELEDMRRDMLAVREGLAAALRRASGSDRFGFVAEHRGMFSRFGAPPEKVRALRDDHAIYLVGDSRANIAGLPRQGLDRIAEAFVAVGL